MMPYKNLFIIMAAAIFLSGCSGKCGDPNQDGFIGGLHGAYGGCYDKRIQDKNDQLATQHQSGVDIKRQAIDLNKQYQLTSSELEMEKKKTAALMQDIHSLERHLARLRTTDSQQKRDLTDITAKLQQMKVNVQSQQDAINKLDRMGGSSLVDDSERYRQLQIDRDRLRQEYKALLEYTQAIDKAAD